MRRVQIIEESIRRFLYHGGEVVGMTVLPKELPVPKHLAFDLLRSAEKGSKTPPPGGGGEKPPPVLHQRLKPNTFCRKSAFSDQIRRKKRRRQTERPLRTGAGSAKNVILDLRFLVEKGL